VSLGIFGLILLGATVGLCWAKGRARTVTTAILALLLGLVIAGTNGPLGDATTAALEQLRAGLDGLADATFGGEQ